LHNEPEIIQEIRAAGVRWLEHIFTTGELYRCRKLTFKNPVDARKMGRPPIRWMVLMMTLKEVKLTKRKTKAANRMDWRSVFLGGKGGGWKVGTGL